MVPGVFPAQPLMMARRTLGTFAVENAVLAGSASYVQLSGDFVRGGQVVQVTSGATGGVGFSLVRLP